MKAFVALIFGLILACSAPAFASTAGAYVGDMLGSKPAPTAPKSKTAEYKTTKHHEKKHIY